MPIESSLTNRRGDREEISWSSGGKRGTGVFVNGRLDPPPTYTPTSTHIPIPTWTPVSSQTRSMTNVPTGTRTPTPTQLPTHAPTQTPMHTHTATLTATPSETSTPTRSPSYTPTGTSTRTPTFTPSITPTNTHTPSPTQLPPLTPIETNTPPPPTSQSFTLTNTHTATPNATTLGLEAAPVAPPSMHTPTQGPTQQPSTTDGLLFRIAAIVTIVVGLIVIWNTFNAQIGARWKAAYSRLMSYRERRRGRSNK